MHRIGVCFQGSSSPRLCQAKRRLSPNLVSCSRFRGLASGREQIPLWSFVLLLQSPKPPDVGYLIPLSPSSHRSTYPRLARRCFDLTGRRTLHVRLKVKLKLKIVGNLRMSSFFLPVSKYIAEKGSEVFESASNMA